MDNHTTDSSGTLEEALERLHRSGPERQGWLSNHAPMAVEALVRHGQGPTVHRWLDRYRDKLEDMPGVFSRVTDDNWREALGDPRQLADWIGYFSRTLDSRPWRDVLAQWWPRLLPGIAASATHGVIRVGHAVRTLLIAEGPGGDQAGPRQTELAHALGYWAARHQPLTGIGRLPAADSAAAGLAAVPRISDQNGGIRDRFARITALPGRPSTSGHGPEHASAEARLTELVRAATHRYATHAHGEPVMLVHAATAPNAVLRVLPALPHRLWVPSLDAAWSASAAVTAAYSPGTAVSSRREAAAGVTAEEVFERATAHGDEHTIKLTDTALDVAGWDRDGDATPALAAALRATELIEPVT